MYHFFELALSFPVVLFSFLLVMAIFYLGMACLGLVDMDTADAPAGTDPSAVAGVLLKAGLAGVPVTVLFILIAVSGWLISYFVQLLLLSRLAPGLVYYLVGALVAVGVLMVAFQLTAAIVRLLRPVLRKIKGPAPRPICGQVATVRSARVTRTRGEVMLDDGGAGLLLQVRTESVDGYVRGECVVLLHHLAEEHAYLVVSESEFKG